MISLFDRYVVVDWSARNAPATGADSIWVGELGRRGRPSLVNPPTRHAAAGVLQAIIERHDTGRLLLGVDASLGYPGGTSALFGLRGEPWSAMWQAVTDLLVDGPANRNNRFEAAAELNGRTALPAGPFWGCPPGAVGPHLGTTKPRPLPVPEFRHTEVALRAAGWQPKSVWQLLGAGSVGSQTLTVLPVLERLRRRFDDRFDAWPFTTGLRPPDEAGTVEGGVVLVEVWPARFGVDARPGRVRDAAEVAGTALAIRDADRRGELPGWFAPDVDARTTVEREEGWVLGPPLLGLLR